MYYAGRSGLLGLEEALSGLGASWVSQVASVFMPTPKLTAAQQVALLTQQIQEAKQQKDAKAAGYGRGAANVLIDVPVAPIKTPEQAGVREDLGVGQLSGKEFRSYAEAEKGFKKTMAVAQSLSTLLPPVTGTKAEIAAAKKEAAAQRKTFEKKYNEVTDSTTSAADKMRAMKEFQDMVRDEVQKGAEKAAGKELDKEIAKLEVQRQAMAQKAALDEANAQRAAKEAAQEASAQAARQAAAEAMRQKAAEGAMQGPELSVEEKVARAVAAQEAAFEETARQVREGYQKATGPSVASMQNMAIDDLRALQAADYKAGGTMLTNEQRLYINARDDEERARAKAAAGVGDTAAAAAYAAAQAAAQAALAAQTAAYAKSLEQTGVRIAPLTPVQVKPSVPVSRPGMYFPPAQPSVTVAAGYRPWVTQPFRPPVVSAITPVAPVTSGWPPTWITGPVIIGTGKKQSTGGVSASAMNVGSGMMTGLEDSKKWLVFLALGLLGWWAFKRR
jgi:hypothetical protein